MQATKPSEKEIVLTGTFAAPRQAVFDALTQKKHLVHWMKTKNMALVGCEVDARVGGTLRYVFQRPSGRKLEVRGVYTAFEPPRRFDYTETYDFTPLTVLVTMALDEEDGKTIFKQTLRYASKQECDDDFEPVSTSAKEVYPNLARYLAQGAR